MRAGRCSRTFRSSARTKRAHYANIAPALNRSPCARKFVSQFPSYRNKQLRPRNYAQAPATDKAQNEGASQSYSSQDGKSLIRFSEHCDRCNTHHP
jgi:hypothetical protein